MYWLTEMGAVAAASAAMRAILAALPVERQTRPDAGMDEEIIAHHQAIFEPVQEIDMLAWDMAQHP